MHEKETEELRMELQLTDRSAEGVIKLVKAMIDPSLPLVSNLANLARVLYEGFNDVLWAGFYLSDETRTALYLGPYQGPLACTKIPFGKGVCGGAAARQETLLVPDVHEFPGHIACDSASNSEIVLPIFHNGKVVGVLDIDSPYIARFDEEDKEGLQNLVEILEHTCEF